MVSDAEYASADATVEEAVGVGDGCEGERRWGRAEMGG